MTENKTIANNKEEKEKTLKKDKKVVSETLNEEEIAKKNLTFSKTPFLDKTVILTFLLVFMITVVVLGGIMVSQEAIKKQAERRLCSPCPSINCPSLGIELEPPASPSSQPKLDKKSLKIKVLNGNGIRGSAAKLKDFLLTKGYEEIEVGNADKQNYELTLIQLKASKEDYLSVIKEDLGSFSASVSAQLDLEEDEEFDAVITMGKS